MPLFAVFKKTDRSAVNTFKKYIHKDYNRCSYICFSPYYNIKIKAMPDENFYVGSYSIKRAQDFVDQFNSQFKNLKLELIYSERIRKYEYATSTTSTARYKTLKTTSFDSLRNFENSTLRQLIKRHKILKSEKEMNVRFSYNYRTYIVSSNHIFNYYNLFKISTSDEHSKYGDIIVNKMVAILIRMLSPSFAYIDDDQASKYELDWLQVIVDASKKNKGGDNLNISYLDITKEHLLALDDVEAVSEVADRVRPTAGYEIAQTSFIRDVYKTHLNKKKDLKRTKDEKNSD